MQVTGSNQVANIRYGLSIRQGSDGQSFSLTEATLTEGGESIVEVSIDTPQQMLLPATEGPSAEEAFAMCGVAKGDEMQIVESAAGAWRLAALLPTAAIERITKRHGGLALRYTSPLVAAAERATGQKRTGYTLILTKRHLYVVASREGAMLYAAALHCPTPADLLYSLATVKEEYPLEGGRVWLSGRQAAELRKEVKRYFGKTVLE